MMRIRVVIADDEWLALERLRRWLAEEPGVEVVAECRNGREALDAILRESPDLVLLDIRMPELDGFEVIRALSPDRAPVIVIVSAHDEFALRAFDAQALDYLLKPFDRERFQVMMARARLQVQRGRGGDSLEALAGVVVGLRSKPQAAEKFAIRTGGRLLVVDPAEVDWIQCADNYAELHVGRAVHLLRQTLRAMEQQLPSGAFVRISRSVIVNVDRVREVRPKTHGDYQVVLRDGTELPASRNYRDALQQILGRRGA